jgi:multiple sugar transport system ATP-binding protein
MAAVTLKSVWKYYGKTVAVSDLSLDCPDNSFLCVLGPSGCGKSSTLRMLAGLEHISAGDILFDDQRVNDLPPKARDIAMVFENYALYPHKTVYQNMLNPLRMRNINGSAADAKVRKAAALLEIGHLLDRRPSQLSGGQKQRVAIGRAIVREPRLFLFDEPIAHLDAKLRAHMRGELKYLQRELGTTTIYVTHDQMEALSMADRVAVMHQGVLQQHGTPDEIYNHPVNEWVAGFVGDPPMNFLDCTLEQRDGQLFACGPFMRVALTPAQARLIEAAKAPAALRLGIRPDDLAVTLGAARSNEGLAGTVFVVEPVGGDTLVYVKLSDDERLLVRTRASLRAEPGTPCAVSANAERLHLFAPDTGLAYF